MMFAGESTTAADPEAQREPRRISDEFGATETNGLGGA
jgi:hypothetical protein